VRARGEISKIDAQFMSLSRFDTLTHMPVTQIDPKYQNLSCQRVCKGKKVCFYLESNVAVKGDRSYDKSHFFTTEVLILRIGILISPLNRTHGRAPFALYLFSDSERNEEEDVDAPLATQGRDALLDRRGINPRGEQLGGAAAVTRGIGEQ
jgi:hypothetical protein